MSPTSWARFFEGYPFSRVEWLASRAELDPEHLRRWLEEEVKRRRRENSSRLPSRD